MKVLCIDTNPRPDDPLAHYLKKLVEGECYTVISLPHPEGYELAEVSTPNPSGFFRKRFIPLSSISETEMERNYKKELA